MSRSADLPSSTHFPGEFSVLWISAKNLSWAVESFFSSVCSVTLPGQGHDPHTDVRPFTDVRLSRTMTHVCPLMLQGTNSVGPHPTVLRSGPKRPDVALPVVLPKAAPQEAPPERPAPLSCPEAPSEPEPTEPSGPPSSRGRPECKGPAARRQGCPSEQSPSFVPHAQGPRSCVPTTLPPSAGLGRSQCPHRLWEAP